MLENERQNNESPDDRDENTTHGGGSGRGLLRRARKAVTRPAGPPSAQAEPGSGPAGGNPAETPAERAGATSGGERARGTQPPAENHAAEQPKADQPSGSETDSAKSAGTQSGRSAGTKARTRQSSGAGASKDDDGASDNERPAPSTRKRTSRARTAAGDAAASKHDDRADKPTVDDQSASQDSVAAAQGSVSQPSFQPPLVIFQAPELQTVRPPAKQQPAPSAARDDEPGERGEEDGDETTGTGTGGSRRRRRGGRGRGKPRDSSAEVAEAPADSPSAVEAQAAASSEKAAGEAADEEAEETTASGRRRRRRRRGPGAEAEGQPAEGSSDDPPNTVVHVRPPRAAAETDVRAVKGSTRLEAKRQRRREGRESGRRRPPIITESEFLARREAVERVMVVRQHGDRTQIAVLEDGVLVEHYVDKASHQSYVGNVYLGKVQNVLPSMEAAFVDIGKGRNAVLYAGEVNFDASGLEGESKRIESALKSGQSILVQVTKDPIGHKGARLTSQVSLPGRYLVYVPGASMTGISRKLPDTERSRLKQILKQVMPENAGVIVRTAAEGASEDELARDVARLSAQWEAIEKKAKTANAPDLLYSEPDLTLRVVRDIFNEDFKNLVIASDSEWDLVAEYVRYVAPHLADRMQRWDDGKDVFAAYRIDEQIGKALERKVWLPSGGSLVIDHTEAMTVIDVNTGKFTGQGGNLEQTVTRNNLEAAEEIVRQLRLRDLGGIIVIDFIDMVLESNRELVLRRLLECLARDRTKHQVAEVTSLGLVQMTRKRVGSGLLEAFSVPCEHCNGRGVIVSLEPVDHVSGRGRAEDAHGKDNGRGGGSKDQSSARNGAGQGGGKGSSARAAKRKADVDMDAAGSKDGSRQDETAASAADGSEAGTGGRSRTSRSRSARSGRSAEATAAPDGATGAVAVADAAAEANGVADSAADVSPQPTAGKSRSGRGRRSASSASGTTEPGKSDQNPSAQATGEDRDSQQGESAGS